MTNGNSNYFKFEHLEVWKESRGFISLIYRLTAKFPKDEQFGLINQVRRAAVSIALNIAEGSTRGSDPDLKRFLKMAQGSLNEVVSGLYIALDQGFVKKEVSGEVYDSALKLNAKLNAFVKSISR